MRFVCVLGAMVFPVAASALANADPEPRRAGSELLVQFDGLAEMLDGGPGLQMRALFRELGLFERTTGSWSSLAASLGMSPDAAVGELLGGRFVLVVRRDDGGDDAGWACVMSVDEDLGARLPRLLKASPRGLLEGRTVYAIEDGRLLVMPVDAGGRRIAVASREGRPILDEAARLVKSWDEGPSAEVDRAPGGVMMVRGAANSWLSGTIVATETGFDFSFIAPPATLGIENSAGAARIDAAWFDRVARGAGIAYAGPIRAPQSYSSATQTSAETGNLGSDAGASEGLSTGLFGGLSGGLSGGVLADLDALRRWAGLLLPFSPPAVFSNGASDFGVFVGGSDRRSSVWMRVPDSAWAAKVGDAHVCDLVGQLAGPGALQRESPECSGRFPDASRRLSVPMHSAGGATPDAMRFAWGVVDVGLSGRRGGSEGWWSMHSVPRGHDAGAVTMAPGLSAAVDAPIMMTTLRPGLLVEALLASNRESVGAEGDDQSDAEPARAGDVRAGTSLGMAGRSLFRISEIECLISEQAGDESMPGGKLQTVLRGVLRLRFIEP